MCESRSGMASRAISYSVKDSMVSCEVIFAPGLGCVCVCVWRGLGIDTSYMLGGGRSLDGGGGKYAWLATSPFSLAGSLPVCVYCVCI